MMRRALVDHAREKKAEIRGGPKQKSPIQAAGEVEDCGNLDPLLFEDSLAHLAEIDADLRRLVELKVFGGYRMEEIAETLCLAPATAYRHWKVAKALLYQYFREA